MHLRLFFQSIPLLLFFVEGFANFSKTTIEYSYFTSAPRNDLLQDTSSCRYKDSLALVSFFKALDGPNWNPSFRWDLTKPITTWTGLNGNSQGCVTSIFFETDDVNGEFPMAITQLSSLESLHLKCKNLKGSLPAEIGRLSKLTNLTIAGTQMKGKIPEEIGQLKNLKTIYLNANQHNGSIPASIGNLIQLEVLNLSTNDSMRGDIPKSLLNLTKLKVLDLNRNQFTGTIPSNIDTLANLEQLLYLGNKISGTLPKNLGKLSKLTVLDLAFNRDLGGTIPKEIGDLKNLAKFNVSATAIEGSIPPELAQLDNLQFFFAAETKLNGDFPNLKSPKLQIIYSNNNQLDGQVPDLNLPGLLAWYLHNNKLKSLPKFSKLLAMGKGTDVRDSLTLYNNRLSFDDLIPNINLINAMKDKVKYHPQDSVYKDTIFRVVSGSSLMINLLIDSIISDNKYTWTKNGQAYSALIQNNRLVFNSIQKSDAGTYFFKITNPQLPLLTLHGRRIKIEVLDNTTTCRYRDSLELVKLYNATNGPSWANTWHLDQPMNTWDGVTLNDEGCVKCLELDGSPDCNVYQSINVGNKLIGQLPNLNLQSLEILDLSNNQLIGTIPNFNLPNLKELDLSYNQFNGSIPNFNLPNLKILWLFNNYQLSGLIPNFKLPQLYWLRLQVNNLEGAIPDFNQAPELFDVDLSYNRLEGKIPDFKLPKLGLLKISHNGGITGRIPNFNGTVLRNLEANNTSLDTMPEFTVPSLERIILYSCDLVGMIPNFKLPKLEDLDLGNNKLTGPIPDFAATKMKKLLLNLNKLTDSIPNFNLSNLEVLSLNYNQLSGRVPDFNLPQLLQLYLNNNKLNGLPEFTKLPKLGSSKTQYDSLTLHHNKFTFEDILPNIRLINKMGPFANYAPQDSIYQDTTIRVTEGQKFKIPLHVDSKVEDNQYFWAKNMQAYTTITGEDTLIFSSIKTSDAGIYQVKITNPKLPLLSLFGRRIKIEVEKDTSKCRYQDSLILVSLHKSTHQNGKWNTEWNLKEPIDKWHGVKLNSKGCLEEINLTGNNLAGTIPEEIGRLENIMVLVFFDNKLSGNIPKSIGNLKKLNLLSFSSNNLSGGLPTELGSLNNLRYFESFANPNLKGTIPIELCNLSQLKILDLWGCGLEGMIPTEIGKLINLNELKLYQNNLSGAIPTTIGKLSNLTNLLLHDNPKLSGTIPSGIGTIPNLEYLTLYATNLNGQIPSSINKLSRIKLFAVGPPYNSNLSGAKLEAWEDTQGIQIPISSTFRMNHNKFTFEDILPVLPQLNDQFVDRYAPQDSIFTDTIFTKNQGEPLTIDLGIDPNIDNNVYSWYKLGSKDTIKLDQNKRVFDYLKPEDSGTYYVQIRNPKAPQLTLYSRKIRINVAAIGALQTSSINQTLCKSDSIRINFSSTIQYRPDNVFQVELSESSTNFNAPTILGSLKRQTANKISLAIPNNLISQKDYFYRIVSTNPRVVSSVNPLKVKIEQALAAPVVKCGQASVNSIVFNWEAVSGATGYQISNNTTNNGIRNGNTVTFTNLPPNSKITLEVQATGSVACPAAKDTQTCVTLNCAEILNSGQALPTPLVCNGQESPILLNDLLLNEDPKGTWSTQHSLSDDVFDPDAGTLIPKGLKAGRYQFRYTVLGQGACSSAWTTVSLNVEQTLSVNITDYSNCLDTKGKTQIELASVAKRVNAKYADQIRWYKDENKQMPITQPVLELAATLTIYAQVGQGLCASPVTAIALKPNEKLNLPTIEGRVIIKVGDTIQLRTTQSYPPGSLFVWKTPDTISSGIDQYVFPKRIASKVDAGRYELLVRAPQEPRIPTCISETAWVNLEVLDEDDPVLKIGKRVSKDTPWIIEGLINYPTYSIKVFNRWGALVFRADSNYLNQWHGTCEVNYNEKELPQGTYYYLIEIPGLKQIVGAVYLLK